MRRTAVALATHAQEVAEAVRAVPQPPVLTVPFEVARLLSRRWLGLVEMPEPLQSSVESAAAAAGRSGRQDTLPRKHVAWPYDAFKFSNTKKCCKKGSTYLQRCRSFL